MSKKKVKSSSKSILRLNNKGVKAMADTSIIKDTQKVSLELKITDAKGNPAKVDGVPEWSSTDSTIVTITPSTDGMTGVAAAVGPLGTASINVLADADLGQGVKTIQGTLDIEVIAGDAVTIQLVPGTPEEQ